MKEVDIDTLRADYPLEYEKQYADWAQSQCDIVCETALDDLRDYAEFELHGTGWHVTDSVNYQLAFSPGDGVAIDSTVYYDEMSKDTLDELRQDFPMCLELLGRDYLHDAEQRVYKRLRDNVEFQTSEDMFIEWARDFDVRFDVEE